MHNLVKIAREDFKKLFSSAISMVVVFGLIVVPSIYTLFNLGGYWDPYSGSSNLEIGIVNNDKGYKSEILPFDIQFGENVISALNENTDFKWIYTDYNTAMNKINSGEFYAVLAIPEDFSQQAVDILSGKTQAANVTYYCNQKRSPITHKLVDNEVNSVQGKINSSFSCSVYEVLLNISMKIINSGDSQISTDISTTLINAFDTAISEVENVNSKMDTFDSMLSSLNEVLTISEELLPSNDNEAVAKLYSKLQEVRDKASISRSYIDKAAEILKNLGILEDMQALLNDMSGICGNIENVAGSGQNIIDDTKLLRNSLQDSIETLKNFSGTLSSHISTMKTDFQHIADDLNTAKNRIIGISKSSTLEDVKKILGDDAKSYANLISSPVVMDRHELFSVPNFGTAISGFFVSISCWVGCLILATMLSTKLSRKREKKLIKSGTYKSWQLYFGRYFIYWGFAILQSTVISLGCIFYLQLNIQHPFMYVFTCWVISTCFSFLIYTLVASFGNLGKVIAVILLVLQVGASGGTFPIYMVTEVYRHIFPYLPISYTIKALNMCLAGFSDISVYWNYMIKVFGTLVGISLFIGLFLRVPLQKLLHWFEEKLHSLNLFGI